MLMVMFAFFAVLSVISAVLIVFSRNPMHSVLYLAFTVLSVAGVFLSVGAEFLGAIQVIVYAGGIVVLYTFVIIIVNLSEIRREPRRFFPTFFIVSVPAVMSIELIVVLYDRFSGVGMNPEGHLISMETLAQLLMGTYVIPFELSSVLLLAVLVGSIYIARRRIYNDPA